MSNSGRGSHGLTDSTVVEPSSTLIVAKPICVALAATAYLLAHSALPHFTVVPE